MKGKTCIVTGATSGIGQATAIGLARAGAELGLVARDPARAEATVRAIRDQTGSTAVEVFLADLGSQAAIRRVAPAILARYPKIHVLVNNAGVVNLHRQVTEDGIEQTLDSRTGTTHPPDHLTTRHDPDHPAEIAGPAPAPAFGNR